MLSAVREIRSVHPLKHYYIALAVITAAKSCKVQTLINYHDCSGTAVSTCAAVVQTGGEVGGRSQFYGPTSLLANANVLLTCRPWAGSCDGRNAS